ncbi:MAG: alpha/beta hydrolase fold domain-containing protein [Treponema sp.]|nr:alpha/beta hydrolase fold domain-containing protein [Treponema sp.]
MKGRISAARALGLLLFICILVTVSSVVLWIIDAKPSGWILSGLAAAGFLGFRLSRAWTFVTAGKLQWLKSLCLYLALVMITALAVCVSRPDFSVSFRGTFVREVIREIRNLPSMAGNGMLSLGAKYAVRGSEWEPPEGYTYTKYGGSGEPVLELLEKDGAGSNKLIIQFHGGAYVIALNDIYRDMAVRYSKLWNDADVLNVDYRIAPEHVFPAALDDGEQAWHWAKLNGYKPEDIVIAGDSAGGNLALALTLRLRDAGEKPRAIICMSPWADLAGDGESHKANLYKDPMFGKAKHSAEEIRNEGENQEEKKSPADGEKPMTSLYMGDADPRNPYLSPVFASYEDFPSMLIQVGTWEVLESDSDTIYLKARDCGVDVTLSKYRGMWHVFQQTADFVPEAKKAWKEVGNFLRAL